MAARSKLRLVNPLGGGVLLLVDLRLGAAASPASSDEASLEAEDVFDGEEEDSSSSDFSFFFTRFLVETFGGDSFRSRLTAT